MTDTSLIEAVARDLRDHMTVGNDPFGVALADTMYVENMAKDAADAKRIVDEMCRIAAVRMVGRVRRWEAENGWRYVPKEPATAHYSRKIGRNLLNLDREAYQSWADEYSAMVSASPPPPGSAEGVKE